MSQCPTCGKTLKRTDIAVPVTFRLHAGHLDRLDEICYRLTMTRTDAIRYMIDHTDLPETWADRYPSVTDES